VLRPHADHLESPPPAAANRMRASNPRSEAPAAAPAPGLRARAQAGAAAGLVAAAAFGPIDGAVALGTGPAMSPGAAAGCLAAAVLVYAGLFGTAGLLLGSALGLLPAGLRRGGAFGGALAPLLAAGIFLEAYWWTRPCVFYGIPATDPRRLLAAGAMAAGALALGALVARAARRLPAGFYRGLVAGLVLAAIGGSWTLLGARRAEHASGRGELNARNRDLPNVLLFVVDALRADVLEPYGHPRVKTPNAQRLADAGVLFENALVQAPYTWTSFGSLLTGKYPRRHGLVLMDPRVRMRRAENVTLPLHLKQAARAGGEALRDGDYAGATFMTGTLSQGSGLMHGFDWYFEAMAAHELVSLDSRWSVFRSHLLLAKIKNKLTQRFDAGLVTTTAIDWLRANAGKRFLGMVHLYSTHTPYDPEPEFRAQYCDPAYAGPIHAFHADSRRAIEQGRYAPTAADVEQIRNLYLAGVAQADRDVGRVLAELERQGVLADTVVILTSDHGEELADHGLWEHNWMFQTNLRIPLIVSWPNGPESMGRGRRVDALVESIDVFPTVCDLLGIAPPAPSPADEYARVDGRSLLPLLRGEVDSVKEFSFAENGDFVSIQDARWKLIVRSALLSEDDGWARAQAGELERPRLFHLADDPGEMHDVSATELGEAERLFQALARWDATMPIPRADIRRSARDVEDERLMEALGYTGGGTGNKGVLEQTHAPVDAGERGAEGAEHP
jgi:arylsulfatase A-like enzyme